MRIAARRSLAPFLLVIISAACTGSAPVTPSPAPASVPPVCERDGTLGNDRVPDPARGFKIAFEYYLPPCYDERAQDSFPVLYLITLTYETSLSDRENTPLSLANRLIRAGRMPPALVVVPDPGIGAGSDAAMALDLVPYVDGRFRTLTDARHRGAGGISHGAAIAARMAFQFPETFGSVVLWSGGIDATEMDRFDGWIAHTSPDRRPRVLIDVGDQDGIVRFTTNLIAVLERNGVTYETSFGSGGHNWIYWSARMEPDLLWLAETW